MSKLHFWPEQPLFQIDTPGDAWKLGLAAFMATVVVVFGINLALLVAPDILLWLGFSVDTLLFEVPPIPLLPAFGIVAIGIFSWQMTSKKVDAHSHKMAIRIGTNLGAFLGALIPYLLLK